MCLGLLSIKIFSDGLMKITGRVFLPSLFFLQLIFLWQCSLQMLSLFSEVMSQLTKRAQSFSQELTPAHIFSSHIFRHMAVLFGGNRCIFVHIGSICKEIPCKYCCSVLEIKLKHYSSRTKEEHPYHSPDFEWFFLTSSLLQSGSLEYFPWRILEIQGASDWVIGTFYFVLSCFWSHCYSTICHGCAQSKTQCWWGKMLFRTGKRGNT